MQKGTMRWLAMTLLAALAWGQATWAAEPWMVFTIPDIHCAGCAKKVAEHVYKLPGVAEVRQDLETKRIFIAPKPQAALSPRAVWEAVEAAKKHPSKLECTAGTFTEKPMF